MDRQSFYVQVVSLGYSRDEVELIPDLEGKRSGRAEQLSITDWRLGRLEWRGRILSRSPA